MRYTNEIKNKAINLVKAGQSPADVAKDMRIRVTTLEKWVKDLKSSAKKVVEKTGTAEKPTIIKGVSPSRKESVKLRLLEAENKHLREKVQILQDVI